jgi:membrane dipeptidase
VDDPDRSRLDNRAQAIHRRVLKLDSHVDVLIRGETSAPLPRSDLDKLRRGGIDVIALAVAVGPGPRSPEGVAAARASAHAKLRVIQAFIATSSAHVAVALCHDDIERIHDHGKIAVIKSFLNARALGHSLDGIDDFYRAGVRLFGLVHVGHNDFADSSRPIAGPDEEFHGLSPLGQRAIGKLNRLGVIIDVSQLTPRGVLQTLQLSHAPVVASHSAVRALVDDVRNLSDLELDAIKANGGVVQITAFNSFLVRPPADYPDRIRALRIQYGLTPDFPNRPLGHNDDADSLPRSFRHAFFREMSELYPKASVKDYVDHIDYVVKRIGIDHVGIGTDFNHGAGILGFQNESEALNVTRELVRRGYDEPQIARIWGGNFLRVFAAVEAVSCRMRLLS